MMKKHYIARALIILTALVTIFGASAVKSHFDTIISTARKKLREKTPPEYEVSRIEELLRQQTEELLDFEEQIESIESVVLENRAKAARLVEAIGADLRDLEAERDLLHKKRSENNINGNVFTHQQVQASAQARQARLQRNQITLNALNEATKTLEADLTQARKLLAQTASTRDKKMLELRLLATELQSAKLKGDIGELSQPLKIGRVTRSQSELAESLKAFSLRVRREQHRVASTSRASLPPLIVHENEQTNLLAEIDAFLTTARKSQAGK